MHVRRSISNFFFSEIARGKQETRAKPMHEWMKKDFVCAKEEGGTKKRAKGGKRGALRELGLVGVVRSLVVH